MSALKRKHAPEGQTGSLKSNKKFKDAQSIKNGPSGNDAKPAKRTEKGPTKAVVSVLKDEEPLFPRGGGSVLTPLEQKQIQLEAKADARREDEFNVDGKLQKKKKRKTVSAKGDKKPVHKDDEDSVKIESLNFKRLAKGSLVLGQVTRINNLDIEIGLPNNLTGHVSIVAISEQLNNRLEADAHEADEESSDDESDIDLKAIYSPGQYLRAHVISTFDEAVIGKSKGRKRIELSLRPSEANSGLGEDDVVPSSTVMAAVVSVEDRGLVMDIGVSGLRAFLPKNEIDATFAEQRLQPGSVFLCTVTGKSKTKVVQLSLLQKKLGNIKNVPEATTINTYLPGTTADVLITNTDRRGLSGKVMGHVDATADLIHSGIGPDGVDVEIKYKIGSKVKARVICNFPTAKEPKLGISLLPHITSLSQKHPPRATAKLLTDVLPISSLVEKCTVRHVENEIGLFVTLGDLGLPGFVHISRVKDGKVDALYETSGPFKVDSVHQGRIIGFSDVDGIFHVSLEKSVLEQQYIRYEDVPVGAVVSASIEKLVISEDGVSGVILKVAEGITGLVAERHLSDVRLQHPEKKFREGMKIKARVLSVNSPKKRMRLTLKKTLVNSEAAVIKSYQDVSVGMQVPGTIIKLQDSGAFIQFYGSLKGFLPISEMSEAYIRDPSEHFRLGQVVSLHVLDVDVEARKLIVSCKDPGAFGLEKQSALKSLQLGTLTSGKVMQKTEDQIHVELAESNLKAILPTFHLTDKSASKNQYAWKRIAVGQTLENLLVIDKDEKRRAVIVSQKRSLVEAAKDSTLLKQFEDAKVGAVVHGFVRNVTATAVFVQFAGSLHALLPRSRLPVEVQDIPDFGMHKHQSIEVKIINLIPDLRRIMVAPVSADGDGEAPARKDKPAAEDDLALGTMVNAKVTSVKDTQLNVQILGSQVQARIDVSQIFDTWDEIFDAKDPLDTFHRKQVIRARVMGVHDAKDHRFLPFSHRSIHSILELTARPSDFVAAELEPLTLDKLKVGDTHLAFVNNVSPQFLWVNISPSIRGRVSAMEASDDLTQLKDLEESFPIGSALKVRVVFVDKQNNRLDLSARSPDASASIGWDSVKTNMVLPGKITKVSERQVIVKLSELVSGPVHLPDMLDDYTQVDTSVFKKNEIVRVSVVEVATNNKRLRLSMRPSRIMSSTLPVRDKEITAFSQLSTGDILRGFVKNVSDKGLFVTLGGPVTALVKISNLSDRYLKEWKDHFQVDQLIKGRIIALDTATKQVEMSLKSSVIDEDYKPPTTFNDMKQGDVVTGKVRKVEDFGAFILIDNSANVSGLCHRSQMAENPVQDATKLYKEGDSVKAVVLEVDAQRKRISFGLKPSFFEEEEDDDDDDEMKSEDEGTALGDDQDSDAEMDDGGVEIRIARDVDESDDESDDEDEVVGQGIDAEDSDSDSEMGDVPSKATGLGAGKKTAWSADPFSDSASDSDSQTVSTEKSKKQRKKAEALVDRTAELDVNGPQTSSDYERLLLGQPDSSELWIAYMAFQMQVSELSKAREVAERAIKSINIREEAEKLNVWVAYLNLEVTYGSKATVEDVFKRACQYNDEQEVYERLASIYIQSEKPKKADELFEAMVKKFGAKSPTVWLNYGHFLHATLAEPQRARALLARASQQIASQHHASLIARFAALEFRSPNGEPELGRTMFAGVLDTYPKKGDLWSQLVDLELGVVGGEVDKQAVRDVFERRTRVKGLKPQQAEKWFRRWAVWEENLEDEGIAGKARGKNKDNAATGKEKVLARAQEWTAQFRARKEKEAAEAAEENEDMEG